MGIMVGALRLHAMVALSIAVLTVSIGGGAGESHAVVASATPPSSAGIAWGSNMNGELGDGSHNFSSLPVAVDASDVLAGKRITQVAAGSEHSCALATDGTVACWGDNAYGQLGDGTTQSRQWPGLVDRGGVLRNKTVVGIAAKWGTTCAVTSDGMVACWGANYHGQLGNGSTTNSKSPVMVDRSGALFGKQVIQVSVGARRSCALTTDGTVTCWGFGPLGDGGAEVQSTRPVAVDTSGVLAGKLIVQVAAGGSTVCLVTTDGGLYCWGGNAGDGTYEGSETPVAVDRSGVLAGKQASQVATGGDVACVVTKDGVVACWGSGYLGNGSVNRSNVPIDVAAPPGMSRAKPTRVATSGEVACVVTVDFQAYCWGLNQHGALGDGSQTNRETPVRARGVMATQVEPSHYHTVAVGEGGGGTPMVFVPVTPARVLDSRKASNGGPFYGHEYRVISVARSQGTEVVPAGAEAVAYNITAPNPSGGGHFRVMPGDSYGITDTSVINFRPGQNIANALTAKVAEDLTLKIYNGSSMSADAVVDITGYYLPSWRAIDEEINAGKFTRLQPSRVFDSLRNGGMTAGKATTVVDLSSAVPAGASAVAFNLSVVTPTLPGHLRVFSASEDFSDTSAINFIAGDRVTNSVKVKVSPDRKVKVYNGTSAPVRFQVEVVGYFSSSGAYYYAVDPARVFSTRTTDGGTGVKLPVGTAQSMGTVAPVWATQKSPRSQVVPAGATTVDYNATVTTVSSAGFLRLWSADFPKPEATMVTWPTNGYTRATSSFIGVDGLRQVRLYNGSTTPLDAVVDVNGYFKP